jgi:hypothetical protein
MRLHDELDRTAHERVDEGRVDRDDPARCQAAGHEVADEVRDLPVAALQLVDRARAPKLLVQRRSRARRRHDEVDLCDDAAQLTRAVG